MREFVFNKTESPSMENFNKRFSDLQNFANFVGNEYVWEKKSVIQVDGAVPSAATTKVTLFNFAEDTLGVVYKRAEVIDGAIVLKEPMEVARTAAAGYYAYKMTPTGPGTTPYLVSTMYESGNYYAFYNCYTLSIGIVDKEVVEYVNSPDPNAYPVNDGYTYTALGMLGEKTRVITGSYVGTGTYGSSNKNSLTFDFAPKMLFVYGNNCLYMAVLIQNATTGFYYYQPTSEGAAYNTLYSATGYATLNGNTVSWYAGDPTAQANNPTSFYYVAIG